MSKLFTALAAASLLMVGGCGKENSAGIARNTTLFESASPQTKADWEKTLAAAASTDYATAILSCRKMQAQSELTPEQRTVINDTMTAMNNQMNAAAQKGDPKALKAVEEVRKRWRSPN